MAIDTQSQEPEVAKVGFPHLFSISLWNHNADSAKLLNAILPKLLDFIASADDVNAARISKSAEDAPSLQLPAVRDPADVSACIKLALKERGGGIDGVEDLVQRVLDLSVNTWDHGFMHKLYSGTNAPGVASELTLAVLNTNVRPEYHI